MEKLDSYIGKQLKRSVSCHRTPANGRARLLQAAARSESSNEGLPPLSFRRHYERHQHNQDWAKQLLDWAMIDAFNTGVANMRILL